MMQVSGNVKICEWMESNRVAALPCWKSGVRSLNHQRIACKHHRFIVQHKRDAAVGMARGRVDSEGASTKMNLVILCHIAIGAGRAARLGENHLTAKVVTQARAAGNMIRVNMRLQRRDKFQLKFVNHRDIAGCLLEHRIDQYSLATGWVSKQVGVS